jgi:HlyD family secretion protein
MLPNKKKNNRRKSIVIPILILLVLAAAVVGYVLISQNNQTATATAESSLKTTKVRLGSLIISATGSGVLVAGQSADLGFPVSGTVGELNVAVGDQVIQGQELAKLADLTSLQTANWNWLRRNRRWLT